MTKYKLKCFTCGTSFKLKEDVFRNHKNHPVCSECLIEFLDLDWACDFIEVIIAKMKNIFNRNYMRWKKWFFENHIVCDGEDHGDYDPLYEEKDEITVINGKNYCRECIDESL